MSTEFELWKKKLETKINEFLNLQFKESVDLIQQNWTQIQHLTSLKNLEPSSSAKIQEHTNTLVAQIVQQTSVLDENLSLLVTHFSLNLPAKVSSENGDEMHYSTCSDILSRLAASQSGARTIKDSLLIYVEKRADMVEKISKYPGCEDRKNVLNEFDFSRAVDVTRWYLEIQTLQLILYNVFDINADKLSAVKVNLNQKNEAPDNFNQFSYFG